jgi:hypothetical protein
MSFQSDAIVVGVRIPDRARRSNRHEAPGDPGEVAGIVHRCRPVRSAIAGGVHREDVEARAGEIRHPAVVRPRDIEGHLCRRAGAVDEERDPVGVRRIAEGAARLHALADVNRHILSGNGRHRRLDADVVIDRQQPLAVVAE